jgi:hypothetical protein
MKKIFLVAMLLLFMGAAFAQTNAPWHSITIVDERGVTVTDITSVEIYAPNTTTDAIIFSDRGLNKTMEIPITEVSTNTTLIDGVLSWYGPDGYDFSITDGTNILTNANHRTRTATEGTLVFPSYIVAISSTTYADGATATFGSSADWVAESGTASDRMTWTPATPDTSAYWIGNTSFPADLNLWGATSTYNLTWDASDNRFEFNDNVILSVGTGNDFTITHVPNTTTIAGTHTVTGVVTQQGDVLFDGTAADIRWDASEDTMGVLDDAVVGFGNTAAAPDIEIKWDQTDLDVTAVADGTIWKWGNGTNDFDMWWYGSDAADYMIWDEGAAELRFQDAHLQLNDDGTIIFGTNDDWTGTSATAKKLLWTPATGDGSDSFDIGATTAGADFQLWGADTAAAMILWDSDADALLVDAADIFLGDSDLLVFGDAVGTGDIKIYATGTDLIIDGIIAETGTVSIGLTDLGLDFKLWAATSAEGVLWDASDEALEFTGANLTLDSASGINFPLEVVAATNVITTDEAGKIFVLSDATEFASTLPTASTAAGMVVTFIIADAPESADYTISTGNTHENIMYGMVLEADVDTGDDGPTAQAQDRCNFKDGVAVIGDYVILICDGTNWYVRGMTAADGGVTFDTQ